MARQLDLSGLDLRRSVKTFVLIVLLGAGAATAHVSPTDLVTAVRDGNGNLRVIPWLVSASGSVNRLAGTRYHVIS